MNVEPIVRWASLVLAALDDPNDQRIVGEDPGRLTEKLTWVAGYRREIESRRRCCEVIGVCLSWINTRDVVRRGGEALPGRLDFGRGWSIGGAGTTMGIVMSVAAWVLDRLVVRPSRHAVQPRGSVRTVVTLEDGRRLDSFVHEVVEGGAGVDEGESKSGSGSGSGGGGRMVVAKFPGTAGRGECSSAFPISPTVLRMGGLAGGSVHTWNPPGYGQSDGRATLAAIGDAAVEYARAVAERPARVRWLVGNSLGCCAALSAAAALPPGMYHGVWLRNPPPLADVIGDVASRYPGGPRAIRRVVAALPGSMNAAELIRRVQLPVAVMTSGADTLVRPARQSDLLDLHPGRHRQIVLPGLRHDEGPREEHAADVGSLVEWLLEAGL